MKKILLFAFCFITTLMASAQTDYATALDLQMGKNTYTHTGSSSSSYTTHYKYTATQDELLIIDHVTSMYISVYTDTVGTSLRSVSNTPDYSNYKEIYTLTKDQTVYVDVRAYDTTTECTVATQATEYVEGDSCDVPIVITDGKYSYFKAGAYDYSTYAYAPHYLQYTAAEEGVLVMSFFSPISQLTVKESCTDAGKTVDATYSDDHTYIGKYTVEAGKTYIISAGSYNNNIALFTLTHPTEGSSCDLPFLVKLDSLNVLPKEAGTYWYQIVSPKQGYAVINSDATLNGGSIYSMTSCSAYSASAQTDGYLLLRSALNTDSTLMVCIEKNEATAEDQTFSVAIESEQPGDSFNNPIEVEDGGEYTTPVYNGSYYYKISVPADAPKKITVAAVDETSIQTTSTTVSLYDSSNRYYTTNYGNKSVSCKAAAGSTYYVKWYVDEDKNNIKFNVTLEDLKPGELYSTAIPAVLGENGLPKADEMFYSYTATKSAKLIVDTDPGITVTFPKGSGSYDGYYEKKVDGTKTRINATEGTQYIIKFVGMTDSTTFILSEEDYEEGETQASAIEMTSDSIVLPSKVHDTWYYYVAPSTGKLTVKSDISYEYDNISYATSNVYVGIGANGYLSSIQQYNSNTYSYYFEGKTSVNAGDTAYIHVVTVTTQSGSLVCKVSGAEQGEISSNPIPLVEGENAIKQASYDAPVWYSIDLNKGDSLYVTFDYAAVALYNANDLNTELVYTKYTHNEDYSVVAYYLAYKNEGEAGTFLLQVNNTYYGGTTANVQIIKESTQGISNINAKSGLRTVDAVYDMQGRKVNAARLTKGLYIINGKKVIVK